MKSCYFRGRNFRGEKISRFSRFFAIFAKVSAHSNSKLAKVFAHEITKNSRLASFFHPIFSRVSRFEWPCE